MLSLGLTTTSCLLTASAAIIGLGCTVTALAAITGLGCTVTALAVALSCSLLDFGWLSSGLTVPVIHLKNFAVTFKN